MTWELCERSDLDADEYVFALTHGLLDAPAPQIQAQMFDEPTRGYPERVRARGTKEWVKEPLIGRAWLVEYAMYCLGHGFAVAAACEFYYRLGKAHAEFESMRACGKKPRSVTSG